MNREQFLEYVDHFNKKRYDAVTSYFAPDITVEYFTNFTTPWRRRAPSTGPRSSSSRTRPFTSTRGRRWSSAFFSARAT